MSLETRIHYSFNDSGLLEQAMTHSSYYNENRRTARGSNERLEFLGDAVLGLLTGEYLYRAHPSMPEGELTKLRSRLVCEPSLSAVANALALGTELKLGKGESACGGRTRPSVLADAVEALLAAVYLDGGLVAAQTLYESYILPVVLQQASFTDYKTQLQELVQRQPNRTITYALINESGPEHAKLFTASVSVDDIVRGTGTGSSRKEAEQRAAEMAMSDTTWY